MGCVLRSTAAPPMLGEQDAQFFFRVLALPIVLLSARDGVLLIAAVISAYVWFGGTHSRTLLALAFQKQSCQNIHTCLSPECRL